MEWKELYNIAKEKLNSRTISPFIDAGGVAAAILTTNGNIYTGVCIDTACTLGMCAERNAIANMITNGQTKNIIISRTVGADSISARMDSISARMVENIWHKIINQYKNIQCPQYVITPNHYHAIIVAQRADMESAPTFL